MQGRRAGRCRCGVQTRGADRRCRPAVQSRVQAACRVQGADLTLVEEAPQHDRRVVVRRGDHRVSRAELGREEGGVGERGRVVAFRVQVVGTPCLWGGRSGLLGPRQASKLLRPRSRLCGSGRANGAVSSNMAEGTPRQLSCPTRAPRPTRARRAARGRGAEAPCGQKPDAGSGGAAGAGCGSLRASKRGGRGRAGGRAGGRTSSHRSSRRGSCGYCADPGARTCASQSQRQPASPGFEPPLAARARRG